MSRTLFLNHDKFVEFGLTKERIRQIKECALKKLRSEALEKSITSEIYS